MIQPTQDRMVVVPNDEVETMTEGGLHIPTGSQEKPIEGEIIAVGPGKISEYTGQLIPMSHVVGQNVLYGKYAGTEIVYKNETYLLLTERDVFAVV